MDHRVKANAIQRLKSVHGHVAGIIRMAEDDAYCIDLIRQIQAVQAALDKVASIILDGHLDSCLVNAIRGDDPKERERVLSELSEVFRARSAGHGRS